MTHDDHSKPANPKAEASERIDRLRGKDSRLNPQVPKKGRR